MKIKFLYAFLFLFLTGDCFALSDKEKMAVATGAGIAVGLWSYWSHVSNKNAISGAERLWDECKYCVGKQDDCLCNDLQKSLSNLKSSMILINADEIIVAYDSLSWKSKFFWNRSFRLKEALSHCNVLKKSVDAYGEQLSRVKQQITICSVEALWQNLSKYDFSKDAGCEIINNSTLKNLLSNELVGSRSCINKLYSDLVNSRSHCYEFAQAKEKILSLKFWLDKYIHVIEDIKIYDEILLKYNDVIETYGNMCSFDIIMVARQYGKGEFKLLSFVKNLGCDISRLSSIKLFFDYPKFVSDESLFDSKNSVIRQLIHVRDEVCNSWYYKQETFLYNEKIRMEQERRRLQEENERLQRERLLVYEERNKLEKERLLQEEQRLLNDKLNKINREMSSLEDENLKLQAELDRQKNKKD